MFNGIIFRLGEDQAQWARRNPGGRENLFKQQCAILVLHSKIAKSARTRARYVHVGLGEGSLALRARRIRETVMRYQHFLRKKFSYFLLLLLE